MPGAIRREVFFELPVRYVSICFAFPVEKGLSLILIQK